MENFERLSREDPRWLFVAMSRQMEGTGLYKVSGYLQKMTEGEMTPSWAVLEARKTLASHQPSAVTI